MVGPFHGVISNGERWCPVQNLLTEPAPGVEYGSVRGTGEWILAVRAESVCDYASLR